MPVKTVEQQTISSLHRNRAAVAVANKLARILWAVASKGKPYRSMPSETTSAQNAPA